MTLRLARSTGPQNTIIRCGASSSNHHRLRGRDRDLRLVPAKAKSRIGHNACRHREIIVASDKIVAARLVIPTPARPVPTESYTTYIGARLHSP